jgi:periplasmic protein TonB
VPAYAEIRRTIRPRERAFALVAVAGVQIALGLALLSGLKVTVTRPREVVQRLIEITLPHNPPPVAIAKPRHPRRARTTAAAPKAERAPIGGSPRHVQSRAPSAVAPIVALRPAASPSGGGTGSGPASGSGTGGGSGGRGYGAGEGGGDLELIAGEILPSDYPRELGNAGIGGRVSVTFTVEVNGRATGCRVTRSSRTPQLDALTCRIIEQRFRFRPSTDRNGRPIPDEVDWDHDWIPSGRRY